MIDRVIARVGALAACACVGSVTLATGGSSLPGAAPLFVERPGDMEFSGRLIARVRQGLPAQRDARARDRLVPLTLARCVETDEYLLVAPPAPIAENAQPERGSAENDLAARLLVSDDCEYVTPDWRCWPQSTSPNDPFLSLQWHHSKVQTPAAWDLSTGAASVIVAFVDTGIDLTHPDLAAARVSGYNSASHLAESAGGQVNDIVGHGTHVAGCGAAIGNNGVGVSGMGWSLKIMMVRTSNDSWGSAFVWDILEGARWAVDHSAKVVNVSYAGVETPSVQTTGAYIRSKGGLLVFAADNTSSDHSDFDWPDVLVVGAVDQTDRLAWFSSYGKAVDVVAPGTSIYSTKRWGGYEYRDGTSFAAPLVAGLAGVVWSISPSFTSAQVEGFIESTCTDLGAPGNDDTLGWGRINAFEAIKKALGAAGPHAPTALPDSAMAFGGIPTAIDVLGNDYDVNGDAITIPLLRERSALGATIFRSRGTGPGGRDQITYFAPATLSGTDTFQYNLADTTGRSAIGNVTVVVTPHCTADVDYSGFVNAVDFDLYLEWFETGDGRADINRDGFVGADDFDIFLAAFNAGC